MTDFLGGVFSIHFEVAQPVAPHLGATPGFFQLYTPRNKDLAESLITRAEAAADLGVTDEQLGGSDKTLVQSCAKRLQCLNFDSEGATCRGQDVLRIEKCRCIHGEIVNVKCLLGM